MNTNKVLFIAWTIIGIADLIIGVTRLTFLCVWLLYLMELANNVADERRKNGKTES